MERLLGHSYKLSYRKRCSSQTRKGYWAPGVHYSGHNNYILLYESIIWKTTSTMKALWNPEYALSYKIDLKALPARLRALPHYFAVRGISKLGYVSTLAKMLNPHFFRTGIRGHMPFHMLRFPGIEAMTWLANYPITCSSTHSKRRSSRSSLMLTMLCRRMWRKIPSRSCTMSQSWLKFTVASLQFFTTIAS